MASDGQGGLRKQALLGAFILSFAVYLIPLLNVHAGWLPLGVWLVGFTDPYAHSWAMPAGALILQGLAFTLTYWSLRRIGRWKWLALAGAIPGIGVLANFLFVFAIPVISMVEVDWHRETGDLIRVCSLPETSLAPVRSGTGLVLERAGEAWIILHEGPTSWKRARLIRPDCRADPVAAPRKGSNFDHVATGGHLLFEENQNEFAYLGPGMKAPRAMIKPPDVKYWKPILSDDGQAVIWLDREPRRSGPRRHRLRLRHLDDGSEEIFPLTLSPRDRFELIGADSASGPFTLSSYPNEVLAVDRDGRTVRGPVSPPELNFINWSFRWVGDGWVAWDTSRDEGADRVIWSLGAGGTGELILPRGKGIASLAVAPDGRHIAVSMSSRLSFGVGKSAVVLLRTSDGKELYRRYHPNHARIQLAFLGNDHLAMTRPPGRESALDVHRVPGTKED